MKNVELILKSKDENIIYKGRLTNLQINEELILQKSMEFFSDPAPCFIHRSAVMKRLYMEVEEFLNNGFKSGKAEWRWEELPENLRNVLQQKAEISIVQCNKC